MYTLAPDVYAVKPLKGYCIEVTFANGEYGVFDCAPYMEYEFMSGLKDKTAFDKVLVDHGTVAWPTGQDLCPESVYSATDLALSTRPVAA